MNRIILVSAILTSLLTIFPLTSHSSLDARSNKAYTIGISAWTGYPASVQGFKDAMKRGGFVEGNNVEYLFGKSGLDKEKARRIVEGFRDAEADLVYSLTTPGTTIAKEILPETTPIVFSIVTYPADVGLIESFEYSGNNLVGTSNYVELKNYVRLLETLLPDTKTLALFHRKREPNSKIQAANIIRLLKKNGIHVIDLEPSSVDEMRQMALDVADRTDVYMTTTDTLCQGGGEKALIEVALKRKIPILSSNKTGIENGSTFGPVADFYTIGEMAGEMAVQILKKGIHPSRLQSRIQDPPLTLINRNSAEAVGMKVPENELRNFKYCE